MTAQNVMQPDNAIHRLLDAAGIPWRLSRRALTERYGIRRHPAYCWEIVDLPTPVPILEGLLWPLSVQARPEHSPHLPATYLSSVTSFGEHSRDNLRRTAKQLEPLLGKSQIKQQYNTEKCEWIDRAASLRLVVWPLDLQHAPRGDNPSHTREPRLATGCYVDIDTGFMPAASVDETAWIRSFVPIARISFTSQSISENELEFVRAPIAEAEDAAGMVGYSADRAALMVGKSQLFVLPIADVLGFTVHRLLPAKGPGGSWLKVECRTQSPELRNKTLTVTTAPGADDLNDLGQKLADLARKPFVLGEYDSDC
jgi:hypothetical protein